jgi:hypothetical protein
LLDRIDVVDDELWQVFARFPTAREKIKWLARNSEDFRQICFDYGECTEARNNLKTTLLGVEDFLMDFRELLERLEEEIRPWLEIDEKIQRVLDLVPSETDRVLLLVRHNPCFRMLCEDYADRLEALSSALEENVIAFPQNVREIESQVRLWLQRK